MIPSWRSAIAKAAPMATAIAGAVGLALAIQNTGVESQAEQIVDNLRLQAAPKHTSQHKVVVVDVGDDALQAWEENRMLWLPHIARVLDRVRSCDPSWIGVDWVFLNDIDADLTRLGLNNPNQISALRSAMKRARDRLTLASALSHGAFGESIDSIRLIAGENVASVDLPPEPDQIRRRLPVVLPEGRSTPGFSFALAARSLGLDPDDPEVQHKLVGDAKSYGIDFRISNPPELSAVDLASDQPLTAKQKELLKGAVVIIGATNSLMEDFHATPLTPREPGVMVHALGVATVLDGTMIQRPTAPSIALFAAGAAVVVWFMPVLLGSLIVAIVGAIFWVGSMGVLERSNTMLPIAGPWLAMICAAASVYLVQAYVDARRRALVEAVFGANVSPEIRDLLLTSPDNMKLGGRNVIATILFVDMRESVAMAYGRDPEIVMQELNTLFAAVVPAVHRHGGLLSRFTGDGFLALFGVPIERTDHADAAIETAIEIQHALANLNAGRTAAPLRLGCGINTGKVVCGNIGVEGRSEFTPIGDAVNVAARIESLTKKAPSPILISESTRTLITLPLDLGDRFEEQIAGRNEATVLYPVFFKEEHHDPK